MKLENTQINRRNFYGRRHGKTLHPRQKKSLKEDLPDLSIKSITVEDNPNRDLINPVALFPNAAEIWLEIGFGGGEHLAHMAKTYPSVGLIGCEPFINGVAMLLGRLAEHSINNVLIHADDARDLMDVLPKNSISKAFLLYPDPWPKTRHHRRRFVNPEFITPLANCLKSGAEFRIATDIPDYVRHSLETILPRNDFHWKAKCQKDWQIPWTDWVPTRYEEKARREGRSSTYLTFQKL